MITREPWKQSEFRVYVYPHRRWFRHGFRWSLVYTPMRDLQVPVAKGWRREYRGAVWDARRAMVRLIVASHNHALQFAGDGDDLVRAADEADDVASRQW